MRTIIIVLGLSLLGFWACQDITVGYLDVEYAGYEVDTLVIRTVLDTTPPVEIRNEEYYRRMEKFGYTHEQLIWMGVYPTILGDAGADYTNNKYNIPYVSNAIEGVEGTQPLFISVKEITSETGDVKKLESCLTVRSDGTFMVPIRHGVPAGRYVISLWVKNEGYTKELNKVFTIISR